MINSKRHERDGTVRTAPDRTPHHAPPAPGGGFLIRLGGLWPTALAVVLVVVTFVDGVPPVQFLAGLLVVMPLCYLLFGALRKELGRPRTLAVQVAALLAFACLALVALAADQTVGLRLVAAGWLAHGVWDFVHHRTGRVVPRGWSQWCGVVDVGGALTIVLLA
ncbi:hypothetical protein [Streptomyces sp. NPDC048349]|uniref:hypothetical protein n=1 Tax=Streptomyces sp. NPDC048349 TaxID=3155486 RepID=UPI00343F5CDE